MERTVDDGRGRCQEAFEDILRQLLIKTDASRTTLRADLKALGASVDLPVAEALQPGVRSLRGEGSIDQRAAETVRWLERHRTLLVQGDFDREPRPPAALVQSYGTKAQMLGPVLIDGELIGWISVHENSGPRRWSEGDIAALREAVRETSEIVEGLVGQVRN